jgi:outer membrane protein OmpA-like peptidoglycan-associated protein
MNRLTQLTAAIAAAALLAGCATTHSQNGQSERSNTTTGAAIGAAVGAAVGALSGDGSTSRRDRALLGAAAGAAAGGGIGAYMDRQEEALRERTEGTGIGVDRRGDDIVLDMPSEVTFGFDSSALTANARNALNEVASVLREYADTRVNIAGHTDSTGDANYNQRLSEQRASSVGNYLAQRGIARNRLSMRGYGESRPVASNNTEQGQAQNRRVEITLSAIENRFEAQ